MFQFKFLQNILVNNYWLEKWKILDTISVLSVKKRNRNFETFILAL